MTLKAPIIEMNYGKKEKTISKKATSAINATT
jgi:hypothetical protein